MLSSEVPVVLLTSSMMTHPADAVWRFSDVDHHGRTSGLFCEFVVLMVLSWD